MSEATRGQVDDRSGGMAVWPVRNDVAFPGSAEFVPQRPSDVPADREHRVFTQPYASAMISLVQAALEYTFVVEVTGGGVDAYEAYKVLSAAAERFEDLA